MPHADLESRLGRELLLFDGAMGTSIQFAAPPLEAFEGHEGLNEWLVLSRPALIEEIHAGFLEAGSDIVETDSFGSFSVVLDEYGLGGAARELGQAAAALARRTADRFATPARPRWVAGSIGPGTRLPSLGQIRWAALVDSYSPLVEGLLDGGVDLLLVETVQDPLQAKAALEACERAFRRRGRRWPVGVQITVETTGTLLLGTEPGAALCALGPWRPAFFGLNCATGPASMRPQVLQLAAASPFPLSVQPNAGLPRAEGGRMIYDLAPEDFARQMRDFVLQQGVLLAGGCCGTTSAHLAALARELRGAQPGRRSPQPVEALASLYSTMALTQQPGPLLIGERTNANGSRLFRKRLEADDWEGLVEMAREQAAEGAHVLDLCTACVGRDERADMDELCRRLATALSIPLMIDSTEPPVIEAALERLGGRAIVNSINLEDGETRARQILQLCRRHGAAVVALCIDEEGMARTPERKLQVARRLLHVALDEGLSPGDLLVDPLTFTLASGDPDYRLSARETLEALRLIKAELPGVRTSLGLSNVSFGLKPALRQALNSVFLELALAAGLDAAILHAGRITPTHQLPAELREQCRRLLEGDHSAGDPLAALLALGEEAGLSSSGAAVDELAALPVEERLKARIVNGRGEGLEADLELALLERDPWSLVNDVLLAGMQTVGELFGAGRLQLPFVLQSAETMKRAVRHLEPRMGVAGAAGQPRGRLLLATVRGDVHDIGKNLVDIIVRNNGWEVENLGIKVPVEQLLEAIRRHPPDAVGLSGLLVRSVFVMRENLEVFAREGLTLPVILGGAALNRRHVDEELRPLYPGPLYYARDAFEGLAILEALRAGRDPAAAKATAETAPAEPGGEEAPAATFQEAAPALDPCLDVAPAARPARLEALPEPPFWGARVETELDLDEVWPWLNLNTLTKGEWGFKRGRLDEEAWQRLERETIQPLLERLKLDARQRGWLRPAVAWGWFPVQAEGRRLWIWRHPDDPNPLHLDFPRQTEAPWHCISDYFSSAQDGRRDVLGLQWVTVGAEATAEALRHLEADRYSEYLYVHGLSVEAAEALAEGWHARMRRELGIAGDDAPHVKQIFRQGYRGSRYSFGYPACPRLEDQQLLAELLGVERIGCRLTEEWQIVPEQSTSALIVHHPEAKYFSV
ncbi:MAG: methionine synthase [Candidatus Delongbacteria bacterium]